MDAPHFVAGFFDEMAKIARVRVRPKGSAVSRAMKKGLSATGSAGWHTAKAVAPWLLLGGVPLALLAERTSRGFGRGVAEAADRPMSHER